MIENYLSRRENLVQVIQLVDARHKPTLDDKTMFDWIKTYNYEPFVVATKLDKLKKSQRETSLTEIYADLELTEDSVLIPFSSETREGREEVLELIDYVLDTEQSPTDANL
jgi:GTP-binding protein